MRWRLFADRRLSFGGPVERSVGDRTAVRGTIAVNMWTRRGSVVRRSLARVREEIRGRWHRFETMWRRSMQLRVVVSTLALSLAVVFVLGMVLQTQIPSQLLAAK